MFSGSQLIEVSILVCGNKTAAKLSFLEKGKKEDSGY